MSVTAKSMYNSYLTPIDDAIIFSDKNITAGVYSTSCTTSVLSHGAIEILRKSWMEPSEFAKLKNVVSNKMEVVDLASRWLEKQKGLSVVEQMPIKKNINSKRVEVGYTIEGGKAGAIKLAEPGELTTIEYMMTDGKTKRINWFTSDNSLEQCGVPRINDPYSISPNTSVALIPDLIPSIKTEALGAKCGACGTCAACAACTACAEINLAAGLAATVAVGALLFLGDLTLAARSFDQTI